MRPSVLLYTQAYAPLPWCLRDLSCTRVMFGLRGEHTHNADQWYARTHARTHTRTHASRTRHAHVTGAAVHRRKDAFLLAVPAARYKFAVAHAPILLLLLSHAHSRDILGSRFFPSSVLTTALE